MKTTQINCGHPALDQLFPRIQRFLLDNLISCNMLGTKVRGYRTPDAPSIWIRDYSDMMRAFRYWEPDMTSIVDHFAETQSTRGWLFDYFTMTPEKVPCEKENWAKYVRVPVEADVEYRFVKAAWMAWQATGNDRWIRGLMPHLEKALEYTLTDPWRWDKKTALVKRGFSIDTWDFDYTAGRHPWLNFQLNDQTFWGIMHGDNSGYYEAFLIMAQLCTQIGRHARAGHWQKLAASFRRRANRLCFNGTFYTHHVPLVPVNIEGVDQAAQLSLSNPMDINRGMATHAMAASIIREYQRRADPGRAFAEWFSIDPPFPAGIFGEPRLMEGIYCNGGIMPLVGGELARAAFEHGFEEYGIQQLLKYEELTRNGQTFLWYTPDGRPATIENSTSPDASPSDAWGSAAMAYALTEGLAGVVDEDALFRRVKLSPRWTAAGVPEAHVCCAYGASGAFLEYTWRHDESGRTIQLDLEGNAEVALHLLLPRGRHPVRARLNGRTVPCRRVQVEESTYGDLRFSLKKKAHLLLSY